MLKRVLVTGFDPFTLDRDIRISNPSGATALALDGTAIETAHGRRQGRDRGVPGALAGLRGRARWSGRCGRICPQVDLFTTVSQGRVGPVRRGADQRGLAGRLPDNENSAGPGPSRSPTRPRSPSGRQRPCRTRRIVAANTGRFPVYDNTSVTEIPVGGNDPVERADGPTAGSTARAGGGGDYLSNEIAYRATLLRDRLGLGATLPGGHVHTPVLQFGADNTDPDTGAVTDPEFVRNRLDIIAQVRSILTVAVDASGG